MVVNGYETQTTFWNDFEIADRFGEKAIKDTYNRAFNEWKDNPVYVTELSMILNWRCWKYYEKHNDALSMLYEQLYENVDNWCCENLKGEDLQYYIKTTD